MTHKIVKICKLTRQLAARQVVMHYRRHNLAHTHTSALSNTNSAHRTLSAPNIYMCVYVKSFHHVLGSPWRMSDFGCRHTSSAIDIASVLLAKSFFASFHFHSLQLHFLLAAHTHAHIHMQFVPVIQCFRSSVVNSCS